MHKRISGWFIGSLAIIVLFIIILAINWEWFPIFLDLYYHASVMMGFEQAGGITLHDFWEYAPVGRPHLYPPLLHVIMLGLLKLGISPINIMRIVSVSTFPLVLFTIWYIVKSFYSERQAFFTVLCASIPYTFFLTLVNAVPASLALIILLLLFYSIEKKKVFAGILLLGLSFFTHAAFPWISIIAIVSYGLFNRGNIKSIMLIVVGGTLVGSPWIIHMFNNKYYFLAVSSYENRFLEVNLFIYILAIVGIFLSIKKKGKFIFPLVLLLAMLPMLINYRYRFLCGQGLLPLSLLAGLGLDGFYQRMGHFAKNKRLNLPNLQLLIALLIFYILTFFTPTLSYNGEKIDFKWGDSTLTNLTHIRKIDLRGNELTIYSEKYINELVNIIKANTDPDGIIYCNYSYAGGMLSALSGRAASSGMLREIKAPQDFNPILCAALIIWIKELEDANQKNINLVANKLKLRKVDETDIAYIYKNLNRTAKIEITQAFVKTPILFLVLLVWSFLVIYYWNRKN